MQKQSNPAKIRLLHGAVLASAAVVCAPLHAQENATRDAASDESVIVLTPFEVSSERDRGYAASETLAGTRIRTDLRDVGGAISVVTRELLNDLGATDNSTLLQYTPNAEVAGTRGTYAGLGNSSAVDETGSLRAPNGAQRVRGLAAADNTRDFFVTDIPWDSYNVDRVDIQRGPNAILFGLGSPAGIVNAQTRSAEFRNRGQVEARFGSHGSWRGSLDYNQVLIPEVLAIRFDALVDREQFQQEPAFEDDTRYYGAIRFDPKLFKDRSFHTSIRAKFEHGEIEANRPRIIPPIDAISPWFRPVDTTNLLGGMGKLALNTGYEATANPASVNPWLASASVVGTQQQPIWFQDGLTNDFYGIYGGYVNRGARNANGTLRGPGDALIGQRYSDLFFGVASLPTYATNARLPGAQYGQYRNLSLLDSSVFDFYNNLIDGPTKSEWENWDAYNFDFSQTAFGDRLAVQVTYDRQKYDRGGQSLLGNPSINIDVLRNFQDLSANPNFARPYIVGGPGGGTSYESDREYVRASLFGELRARDFTDNDFLVKLIGKHRLNGVFSDETYQTENRAWRLYAHSQEWAGFWNRNTGSNVDFKDRAPVSVIYLGPSLANASSASGANISRIMTPVDLRNGSVYHFDSTWTNPAGVNLTDPWTIPADLLPIFNPETATQQLSNPANYTGWNSNFPMELLRYDDGADERLLTTAQLSKRRTRSYAGSWQGFLWNDAIIPTLGWRYDVVKGKSASARPVPSNRLFLNMDPSVYGTPSEYPESQTFKEHSTAGGVVVHLNRFLQNDPLPLNVSFSYNKSSNFQVTDTRRDVYGRTIGNPTGETTDYGVVLSTKDNKYSFRAIRYETEVQGANTPIDLGGLAGTITQGLKFRNVFLYRMSGYTWDTREQTNLSPGQRYYWTPAYVNAAGRPVADLDGLPTPPSGATLEDQAQADARRDASITAWNNIQSYLTDQGFFQAWGYNPTTQSALTDRATYEATLVGRDPAQQYIPDTANTLYNYGFTAPAGLAVTADTQSEGYEFELVANPLPNWRIIANASMTEAVRTNVGGSDLDALVAYIDEQMAGVAGDMRQFNGNYVQNNEVRQNWANWRGNYTLLKLQQGASAAEIRKWRYNIMTNYSFTRGWMKGVGVGGSYRWQDKVVIGYPVMPGTGSQASFDLSKPYYGPAEDAVDLWFSYERRLTDRINWKIQLNIRNAFADEDVIPISVQPDGQTWASVRIKPVQEWFVTNSFSF